MVAIRSLRGPAPCSRARTGLPSRESPTAAIRARIRTGCHRGRHILIHDRPADTGYRYRGGEMRILTIAATCALAGCGSLVQYSSEDELDPGDDGPGGDRDANADDD